MQENTTLALTKALVACPSITPLDAGAQAIIANRLERMGFQITQLPFEDVQNLWATRGNTQPILAFAGHTDVVPTGDVKLWDSPPFTPTIRDGQLFGRGTADMKGSLAAMITAVERFVERHPNHPGTIAFLITSDEEGIAKNGTRRVMQYLKQQQVALQYCLIGEPSSTKVFGDVIKIGRRGSLNCTLKIQGKQGHIAYPERSINPIHHALQPLAQLASTPWDEGNEHFPPTSFQIANIRSGTGAVNVIPNDLECHFNFRFSNESTQEQLLTRVKTILDAFPIKYELISALSGEPFLTKSGSLISACIQAIQEVTSITPTLSTTGGTSDGRFIAPTGCEVVELGPCNNSIHCINESVKLSELDSMSQVCERILEKLLTA
jgi:succinyl-diaminopimelate desuccinylase